MAQLAACSQAASLLPLQGNSISRNSRSRNCMQHACQIPAAQLDTIGRNVPNSKYCQRLSSSSMRAARLLRFIAHAAVRKESATQSSDQLQGAEQPQQSLAPEAQMVLNQVTSTALRVMLKGEGLGAVATAQDQVLTAAAQQAEAGNKQASLYLLGIYGLLEHSLPGRVVRALPDDAVRAVSLRALVDVPPSDEDDDEVTSKPDLKADGKPEFGSGSGSGSANGGSPEKAPGSSKAQGAEAKLQEPYLSALLRVVGLLEDSGWRVKVEGVAGQEEEEQEAQRWTD